MEVLYGLVNLLVVGILIFVVARFLLLPRLKYLHPGSPFLRCPVCKERGSLLKIKDPDIKQADKHEILDYDLAHNPFYIYACQNCKNEVKI